MTYVPPTWPVSVKGVALDSQGRVLLLHNERDEWELPGGRLEPGDPDPQTALEREIAEETGWQVTAGPLLDVWLYEPIPGRRVVIVAYGCTVLTPDEAPVVSHEHKKVGLFAPGLVPGLAMPEGYKKSVTAWQIRRGERDAFEQV
ncbi:NUDIX domain-containing protein [Streptomyces ehimensis]|uniref:NUDIX domain-containing protein n=1 Tax=Streptomyces ehimensis TaxID=68195 RepID=A0ABV9BUT8_9ACTN